MRIPRLWVPTALDAGALIALPGETVHYLRSVLRLTVGAEVVLLDGAGQE